MLDADLLPLVLIEVGDGKNQVLILDMIAPGSQGMAGEGEEIRVRVDDLERLQQAAGVLVFLPDAARLDLGDDSGSGVVSALLGKNPLGHFLDSSMERNTKRLAVSPSMSVWWW